MDVCSWNTGDLGAYLDGPASSLLRESTHAIGLALVLQYLSVLV